MNNHEDHTIPEDALVPASHWESFATRALGFGLSLAVTAGCFALVDHVQNEFQNPDYTISIDGIPSN